MIPILVLDPPPSQGVFHFEFNTHGRFTSVLRTGEFFVLLVWANVSVGMEGFRVHFDEVGHPNDPTLGSVNGNPTRQLGEVHT